MPEADSPPAPTGVARRRTSLLWREARPWRLVEKQGPPFRDDSYMRQNNKKSILMLGGLAGVILFFYFFWLGPAWKDIASIRREREKLRSELSGHSAGGGFYDPAGFQQIKNERQALTEKLNHLKDRIHFRVSPKYFSAGTDQNLLISFQQRLQEVQNDLRKKAVAGNVELPPSLGFPTVNIQPEIIPDYFEKLDMLDQVVTLALESGCRRIPKAGPANLFPEFGSAGPVQSELWNKNMVGLEISGSFAAAVKFIHFLQSGPEPAEGRILTVERIILTNDNQSVDLVQVKILVSGIKIK